MAEETYIPSTETVRDVFVERMAAVEDITDHNFWRRAFTRWLTQLGDDARGLPVEIPEPGEVRYITAEELNKVQATVEIASRRDPYQLTREDQLRTLAASYSPNSIERAEQLYRFLSGTEAVENSGHLDDVRAAAFRAGEHHLLAKISKAFQGRAMTSSEASWVSNLLGRLSEEIR